MRASSRHASSSLASSSLASLASLPSFPRVARLCRPSRSPRALSSSRPSPPTSSRRSFRPTFPHLSPPLPLPTVPPSSTRSFSSAPATPSPPPSPPTFSGLGLSEDLCAALRLVGLAQPSDAQCLAIPALLRRKSLAFAASTGSGKTLAYLLPTMDQLRSDEILRPAAAADRRCSPRALVLAPTRDLTTQIGLVAKALSHHFRLRVRVFEAGAQISKNSRAAKANGADLVVATPQRLLRLHQAGVLSLRGVRHIVVDEADEMLLRGFDTSLQELLRKCPSVRGAAAAEGAEGQSLASTQLSFISATLPAEARHIIRKRWPHVEFLFSKCAHRSPSSLKHFLHECKGDKLLELTSMLHEMRLGSSERMIIFCRGVQSARAVQHALVAEGLPVGGCHGAMPEKRRQQDLHAFLSSPPASPYLVCTDLNARGVDFPDVAHVINFDFPATSALYLHRSGRTARMGRAGKVTSLVKRSELGFAQQIQAAVLKEEVIHNVQKDNTPRIKPNRRGFGRGFGPDAPHMSEKLRPTKKRMIENAARERSAKTRLTVHASRAMARQALAHRRF